MKRLDRALRLITLSILALSLPLASCRSPVQGRPVASLSLLVSVPADLSSPVPEPLLRIVGEAELGSARARPRFIHPDGRGVTLVATRADGSEVGSVALALAAGERSASLALDGLPLGVPLTLTASVYDASDAKVGEGLLELEPLTETSSGEPRNISILPYGATPLPLGEEAIPLPGIEEGRLSVFSLSLTGRGLYRARVMVDGEHPAASVAELYTPEGARHPGFASDPTDGNRYGLFGNDEPGAATYYLVVRGPAAGSTPTLESRRLPFDLPVFGSLDYNDPGAVQMLQPEDPATADDDIYSGYIYLPGTTTMSFELYNPYPSALTIKAFTVSTIEGAEAFFPPAPPAQPLTSGGAEELIMTFAPSTIDDYKATLVIDLDDEGLTDFSMAFYGAASA